MFKFEKPYFWKNPEWYYDDPRVEDRLRLTDKATKKAILSYIEEYANSYGMMEIPERYEIVRQWVIDDIEDYKKNKHRYTIKFYKNGDTPKLIAIDGKKIHLKNEGK